MSCCQLLPVALTAVVFWICPCTRCQQEANCEEFHFENLFTALELSPCLLSSKLQTSFGLTFISAAGYFSYKLLYRDSEKQIYAGPRRDPLMHLYSLWMSLSAFSVFLLNVK